MAFPEIKKRITDFLCGEEGRISKQALISVGAYLGSGVIASSLLSKPALSQLEHTSGGGTHTNSVPSPAPASSVCEGNADADWAGDGACDSYGEPGKGCPITNAEFEKINAYDADGKQIVFGNGRCQDDMQRFHFNGVDFAYAGTTLTAEHHHHGSHNSY